MYWLCLGYVLVLYWLGSSYVLVIHWKYNSYVVACAVLPVLFIVYEMVVVAFQVVII